MLPLALTIGELGMVSTLAIVSTVQSLTLQHAFMVEIMCLNSAFNTKDKKVVVVGGN